VLLMRDAYLVLRKPRAEFRNRFHGFGAGVAWNAADGLQGDRDDPISGRSMSHHVLRHETGESEIICFSFFERNGRCCARGQLWWGEIGADSIDFLLRQG